MGELGALSLMQLHRYTVVCWGPGGHYSSRDLGQGGGELLFGFPYPGILSQHTRCLLACTPSLLSLSGLQVLSFDLNLMFWALPPP